MRCAMSMEKPAERMVGSNSSRHLHLQEYFFQPSVHPTWEGTSQPSIFNEPQPEIMNHILMISERAHKVQSAQWHRQCQEVANTAHSPIWVLESTSSKTSINHNYTASPGRQNHLQPTYYRRQASYALCRYRTG